LRHPSAPRLGITALVHLLGTFLPRGIIADLFPYMAVALLVGKICHKYIKISDLMDPLALSYGTLVCCELLEVTEFTIVK
jgi:hypothetical protein